ncbi:hypothetical protein PIB30_037749 [Stylosanthes scabra]|uniref:Uncharacterized protein n=1 Tax=Stylosanthes scabra TaxID=79078 RepID=A0ABU6TEJ5_9FABA|nr:hypothetical protein [Stylosanthes scabra]
MASLDVNSSRFPCLYFKTGAWREFWAPGRAALGAGYLALACLGVILGADSGHLGVQLLCSKFPRVVLGSNQLSTIDIYIPNRSPRRKLSNAIGIR